jgi:hypothetical protein
LFRNGIAQKYEHEAASPDSTASLVRVKRKQASKHAGIGEGFRLLSEIMLSRGKSSSSYHVCLIFIIISHREEKEE